ncbi:early activation antigen CD69-like [Stigmatopora nigra]
MEMQMKKTPKKTAGKIKLNVKDEEEDAYVLADRGSRNKEASGPCEYSGLENTPEDIYDNILETGKKAQRTTSKSYKVGFLIVSGLSSVLLLVIIVLVVKLKSGSMACPMEQVASFPETCDKDQCKALTQHDTQRFHCCYTCLPGWVRLDHSCFFLSTTSLSWDESEHKCSQDGGFLAVIQSDRVQNFLTHRGNDLKYWIGVQRQGEEWTLSDGSHLNKTYWKKKSPSGDCVYLASSHPSSNNWINTNCDSHTYFICQIYI